MPELTLIETMDRVKEYGCIKCGKCCSCYPCAWLPKEIITLSNFLKLDLKIMLNRYFIKDFYSYSDIDKCESWDEYYLCLKRKGDEEGLNIAHWSWAFNHDRPCIFLDENNLCKVHEARPQNAKDVIFDKKSGHCINKTDKDKAYYTKQWEPYFDGEELNINKLMELV